VHAGRFTNSQRTALILERMQPRQQNVSTSTVLFGMLAACFGVYLILIGFSLLPPAGAQHAPGWVVACAGFTFLCGGISAAAQAFGRANDSGEIPPDAPRWTRLVQHLAALAVVFCLAATGTWVAVGSHDDQFTMTTSLTGEKEIPANPAIARTAFGLGALITWLFFLALARRTVRLLRGPEKAKT
jgi:hypothetical protein